MAERSNIEWCDATFNPWIGCTKVSPACDHCYAERDFDIRRHVVQWGAGQTRKRTSPANWKLPLQWNAKPFYECEVCGLRTDNPMRAQCKGPHRSQHMWKPARRRVFCASLADVFDNEVPVQWRRDLFNLIAATPNLDWLLLTKRIGNVRSLYGGAYLDSARPLPPNVWLGATICNQDEADRDIPKLLATPAAVRFLSIEPMLGPIDLTAITVPRKVGVDVFDSLYYDGAPDDDVDGGTSTLDWVICGGESGPHARPMHPQWARDLRDQCAARGVPFLFKQWGEWLPRSACYHRFQDGRSLVDDDPGATRWPCIRLNENGRDGHRLENEDGGCSAYMQRIGKKAAGRLLDGVEHNEFPDVRP